MQNKLWKFTDNTGSFKSEKAPQIKNLYFPLANESLMSSISPDLHGDIKAGNNSFLLTPVSRIDLRDSRSSRNFWAFVNPATVWSAIGVSKNLKQIEQDTATVEAGLLWHKLGRANKTVGLGAEILSFIPYAEHSLEIMQVTLSNISSRKLKVTPTAAIPIYGRSAENIRDHRQVTSLLNRITLHPNGVILKPTLSFDEKGHHSNETLYFVAGWDGHCNKPQYIYPTQEMFIGDSGDLEAPESVLKNILPTKENIQGKEAMGGLRFKPINLAPGQEYTYIILMGVASSSAHFKKALFSFNSPSKVRAALEKTKAHWINKSAQVAIETPDKDFDNWFRWVSIQPVLRKIFGCSFLPDFDYGKGGRGWRDLWQDCLGLLLSSPESVRKSLINNFSGVRIDGSNATIIGKKPGEFIADRNNISRVWMDHGVWPLVTLDLYLNETGDTDILFAESGYFCDRQIHRSQQIDSSWDNLQGNALKTAAGSEYQGSILEHLLVENLVQFYNVGKHNHIRLEGADWNDGLDMAKEQGESVAFSSMYAENLMRLAQILEKDIQREHMLIAEELQALLLKIDYASVQKKKDVLAEYFSRVQPHVCGKKIFVPRIELAQNLREKAEWMLGHIRENEWLKEGFFNGYYDNDSLRVEGRRKDKLRMTLTGQVFPIMSRAATDAQIQKALKSIQKYLFDKKLKGFHLNSDFKEELHNLGRAFSFNYGDKENGAFFNHMTIMLAYALYKRGYAKEGWQVLDSIYDMAFNSGVSKIYPCLPEYFNAAGRGMYSYLTGSASWFVLTLVTQVFGVRGENGDLLIEPKIAPQQLKNGRVFCLNRTFAGRRFQICLTCGGPKIVRAVLNKKILPITESGRLCIPRKTLLDCPRKQINKIEVVLS